MTRPLVSPTLKRFVQDRLAQPRQKKFENIKDRRKKRD